MKARTKNANKKATTKRAVAKKAAPKKVAPRKVKNNIETALAVRGFDDAVESNNVEAELDSSPAQETGIARYSDAPQFDTSDLYIPKLRMAQGLTSEVQAGLAKPGDWIVMGSEPMKTATIVPMRMVKRRELRSSDDDRAVLCRSADAIIGVGNPGGECAACPMSQWTKNPRGGKNLPAPCTFIYSYIVYVVETGDLCVLEFYRSGVNAGKMLNTMIVQKGLGKFAVQLRSQSQQGPRGSYYLPVLQPTKAAEQALKDANRKTQEMF